MITPNAKVGYKIVDYKVVGIQTGSPFTWRGAKNFDTVSRLVTDLVQEELKKVMEVKKKVLLFLTCTGEVGSFGRREKKCILHQRLEDKQKDGCNCSKQWQGEVEFITNLFNPFLEQEYGPESFFSRNLLSLVA